MPTIQVTTEAFTLAAGQSVSHVGEDAIRLQSTATVPPAITIAGSVSVTATSGARGDSLAGIRVGDGGPYRTTIEIASGGAITVDTSASWLPAYGVAPISWTPVVTNRGTITAIARGDARGILHGGTTVDGGPAVVNAGLVRAQSIEGSAVGVYLAVGDGLANSGTIEAVGRGSSYGVHIYQWDSSFLNTGTIRASTSSPDGESIAVFLQTTIWRGFINAGTLQGDYALKFSDYNGPELTNFPVALPTTFENSGQMIGKVDLGHRNQILLNRGTIDGDISLGSGGDTYSGRDGTATGLVSGGDGNDSLLGGVGFDYLQGNAGEDTINGLSGGDWLVGGQGNDFINGGGGRNIAYGNLGDDVLAGWGGDDLLRGGQGADTLLGHEADDWLSGDRGDDVVTGGPGADIFHTFADAGLDRVTDFNAAEGDRVQLDPGTSFTLRQSGADTVVDMGQRGQLVLIGVQLATLPADWIFGS